MESSVMPGDSGGALLVEGAQGRLYYLGVISAQRGLIPEVTASASERRSLATALYPSLGFISARARGRSAICLEQSLRLVWRSRLP
jgi:hypothetical protein